MEALQAVCAEHGIPLVEDAAQATGAGRVQKERKHGRCGRVFYGQWKNLQTFGGGLIVTDRDDVNRKIQQRIANSKPTAPAQVQHLFRAGLQRWF